MTFNLLKERWIPVLRKNGETALITPAEISRSDLVRPQWPRSDLDTGCLELLIGLVYIACPPVDRVEWMRGFSRPPDLARAFEWLEPAFDLFGDGHRFMQEKDNDEFAAKLAKLRKRQAAGNVRNHLDPLFIDTAGVQAAENNADIMVHRGRYERSGAMDPAMAAMALFTLQTQAPSGGAGLRVSLRGGGPLVTLVDPGNESLWELVWANVPYGLPIRNLDALPWMKTDQREGKIHSGVEDGTPVPAEAFFGMPRRIRLVEGPQGVEATLQLPRGNDYGIWRHPLTPYYRTKTDTLPIRASRSGHGYRNWLGPILANDDNIPAETVRRWKRDRARDDFRLCLSGWQTKKASPVNYISSEQPFTDGDFDHEDDLLDLIEATSITANALSIAIHTTVNVFSDSSQHSRGTAQSASGLESSARAGWGEKAKEEFYQMTDAGFHECRRRMRLVGKTGIAEDWLRELRKSVETIYSRHITCQLATMPMRQQQVAVRSLRALSAVLAGYGTSGARIYAMLDLPAPAPKASEAFGDG